MLDLFNKPTENMSDFMGNDAGSKRENIKFARVLNILYILHQLKQTWTHPQNSRQWSVPLIKTAGSSIGSDVGTTLKVCRG